MGRIIHAGLAAAVLFVPSIAAAAPRTFSEAVALLVTIIDTGTGLLILAGIVVYFWGISTNLLKMKDEGGQAFKAYFVWGIIAIFVMVSIWGIIELLQNTIFGGDYYAPNGEAPRFGGGSSTQFPVFNE